MRDKRLNSGFILPSNPHKTCAPVIEPQSSMRHAEEVETSPQPILNFHTSKYTPIIWEGKCSIVLKTIINAVYQKRNTLYWTEC